MTRLTEEPGNLKKVRFFESQNVRMVDSFRAQNPRPTVSVYRLPNWRNDTNAMKMS